MSYNQRLTTGFKDYSETEWDIEIWQKDYEGSVENIPENLAGTPVVITYGESGRWPQAIQGSDILLKIWASSRFQYDDLASPDATKNLVIVKKAGNIFWKGFIVTDLYEEPIELVSDPVIFQAADLKILESLDFNLTGYKTHFEILRYCLNRLGFNYGFRLATSPVTEFGGMELIRVLANDCAIFSDDEGNVPNCLEVLEEILKPYFAGVCQQDGIWHITGFRNKAANYSYIDFDSAGVQTGTGTFSGVVALTWGATSSFCDPEPGGKIQKLPPIKKFSIVQDCGLRENLVKNSNFDDIYFFPNTDQFGGFDNWVANTQVDHGKTADGDTYAIVKRQDETGRYLKQNISQNSEFIFNASQFLKISLKYALLAEEREDGQSPRAYIYFGMKCGDKYLYFNPSTEVYSWRSGAVYFVMLGAGKITGQLAADLSFKSQEIIVPTVSGQIEIMLVNEVSPDTGTLGACFREVEVSFCDDEGNGLDDEYTFTHLVDNKNSYIPSDIKIKVGNAPSEIPANQLIAFSNISIPVFNAKYGNYTGTLADILAQQIIDMFATIPLKLNLSLNSDILQFGNIITAFEIVSGKRFMPVYGVFSVREQNWEIETISVNTDDDIEPDFLYPDFDDQDWNAGP